MRRRARRGGSRRARGSAAGEAEGAHLARGGFSGAFWARSGGAARAAWEEERPGAGGAGAGARPGDEPWKSPEPGPAGTGAAKAGARERRALAGGGGRGKAPGLPAGLLRASPGVRVHPRPARIPLGVWRGSGTQWEWRVSFCFLSRY